MRTTLTLDDDVAALLQRMLEERNVSLKEVVNSALREGLLAMFGPRKELSPFVLETVSLGPSKLPNMDNIAEVLAFGEGEDYK